MKIEDSLDFLDSCLEYIDNMSEKQVDDMREFYLNEMEKFSQIATTAHDFEITLPCNLSNADEHLIEIEEKKYDDIFLELVLYNECNNYFNEVYENKAILNESDNFAA